MKIHNHAKEYSKSIKARDGRFANSYAPETLRMATFGGQIAAEQGRGNSQIVRAKDMKTATGVKTIDPSRVTTIRQVRHYEDN